MSNSTSNARTPLDRMRSVRHCSSGGGAGSIAAKDANGDDIKATKWLATHKPHDRSLAQGLKGDATYVVVTDDGKIDTFGINAICTHLGCVVPWNPVRSLRIVAQPSWVASTANATLLLCS